MPFVSKKQARWAFANDEPWAIKWAEHTPNMKNLPERAHKGKKKSK